MWGSCFTVVSFLSFFLLFCLVVFVFFILFEMRLSVLGVELVEAYVNC